MASFRRECAYVQRVSTEDGNEGPVGSHLGSTIEYTLSKVEFDVKEMCHD